jgi:hypothetical protein
MLNPGRAALLGPPSLPDMMTPAVPIIGFPKL